MIISETKDIELIDRILRDPEIYDRITDDRSPDIEDFEPIPPSDYVYYLTDEQNIGLIFYHWKNGVTLEGHVHVLKEHREKAMTFSQKALKWTWANTEALKIIVNIPTLYPDVIKFVEKNGFEMEGLHKGSYLKNSVLYDLALLGLSR